MKATNASRAHEALRVVSRLGGAVEHRDLARVEYDERAQVEGGRRVARREAVNRSLISMLCSNA